MRPLRRAALRPAWLPRVRLKLGCAVFVTPSVIEEVRRIIGDSEIMRYCAGPRAPRLCCARSLTALRRQRG